MLRGAKGGVHDQGCMIGTAFLRVSEHQGYMLVHDERRIISADQGTRTCSWMHAQGCIARGAWSGVYDRRCMIRGAQ
jgi:hypothetical protein